MSEGRHVLTNEEQEILNETKQHITNAIAKLNGVRRANIEIELMWHIKNLLKGD